jgi:hypothetical protein
MNTSFQPRRRRRGVAVLLVLLLLSLTLALSYAAMRTQGTTARIQRNSSRRWSAQQDALTGMTMAIKKMHRSDWQGPTVAFSGSLGAYDRFQVTYAAGDSSLTSSSPDYGDNLYRMTLSATGYSTDPNSPQNVSTHKIRAVVRLVPRKLADEPSDWATMQAYTVYQSRNDNFEMDIPSRISGPVRVQGRLKIAPNYPDHDNVWSEYLGDLAAMRQAGQPDYRPFSGPVHLLFSGQEAKYLNALTSSLQVSAVNTAVREVAADWVQPTSLTSYQIYTWGPVYSIPALPDTLQNMTLAPDPQTNPLGIFYRDGSLTIKSNVTIRGAVFCRDTITIQGASVSLQPADMPGLYGSTGAVRLPTVSCQNLTVKSTAGGAIAGFVAVFDTFQIDKGPETQTFSLTGRLVTRKLYIKERQPWDTLNWGNAYYNYYHQHWPYIWFFPQWLGTQGRSPQPLLTVQADSSPITYHWKKPADKVYVPHPDDGGFRWELVSWAENPQTP